MNLFDLMAVIRLDKSEYEQGLNDAEVSINSFGSKLKSALGTAGKVAAASLAAAGTAAGAIGKQAIDAYANYEQLVGGVETLFKDSSGDVQAYAADAYKTAGLSANEYMQTVTSFSASLLQSLGGDTKKAAKIGDMAITDMADNANKMGTSMESIQAAYQGFAKQNYTMLDNLKLGYGGTKTEMERLLADATALSGVNYDIESLADVYEAIHVIQSELDITGTTAKEASTTISGSLASMKSSWENLLVGIADENANYDELINNFVESTATAGENLIPRIEQTLQGIGKLIEGLAPVISESVPQMVETVLPVLVNSAFTMTTTIVNALVDNLPSIIETGLDIIVALADGISESLPELIPTVVDVVLQIVFTLLNNVDKLIEAAGKLIIALGKGLIQAIPQLVRNIPQIIKAIVNALLDGVGQIREIGSQLLTGLWDGINDKVTWLKGKVAGVVDKIKGWFTGKSGFDEHSPSKWAADVFEKLLEGGAEGLESGERGLLSTVGGVVGAVKDSFQPSANMGLAVAGGYGGLGTAQPRELVINVDNNVDGAVFSRKIFRYIVDEAHREGYGE